MNNVWLTLRDAESPAFYRNPGVELPARFVMSIGDALPAASAPVALPARTITVTKGNIYQIANCQLHIAPSPAADYGDPASPYRQLTLAQRLPQRPNEAEVSDLCFGLKNSSSCW
jgi:hypothetical protein